MDAKLQLRVQRYGWDAAEPHYEDCWSDVLRAAHDKLRATAHLAPGQKVIDVACGTGRVTAHLAAAGYRVHAIDISRPMLEVAKENLRPWARHARVYDFDLRHRPIGESFPVILVTLHTFNYLIDAEEQRCFLRHLRRSMASPGIVALDLFCPLFLIRPEGVDEWKEIERTYDDRRLVVRDRRETLTPLLERRTQIFRMNGGPEVEMVTHRRYLPPTVARFEGNVMAAAIQESEIAETTVPRPFSFVDFAIPKHFEGSLAPKLDLNRAVDAGLTFTPHLFSMFDDQGLNMIGIQDHDIGCAHLLVVSQIDMRPSAR